MTVLELKAIINDLPDSMDVFMGERLTEFKYGLVNGASVKAIGFQEEPGGEILGEETVLVLEEE